MADRLTAVTPHTKTLSANNRGGSAGSDARRSTGMSSANKTTVDRAMASISGEVQGNALPAPTQRQHRIAGARDQKGKTQEIHAPSARRFTPPGRRRDEGQRSQPDRQVDVKDPRPAQPIRNHPAQQRTRHAAHGKHRSHLPLIPPAFPR